MSKPLKIKNAVRLSLVLSKEQAEWIDHMCIRMSSQEMRRISVSEAIRMAIETAYPVPREQKDLF